MHCERELTVANPLPLSSLRSQIAFAYRSISLFTTAFNKLQFPPKVQLRELSLIGTT